MVINLKFRGSNAFISVEKINDQKQKLKAITLKYGSRKSFDRRNARQTVGSEMKGTRPCRRISLEHFQNERLLTNKNTVIRDFIYCENNRYNL